MEPEPIIMFGAWGDSIVHDITMPSLCSAKEVSKIPINHLILSHLTDHLVMNPHETGKKAFQLANVPGLI